MFGNLVVEIFVPGGQSCALAGAGMEPGTERNRLGICHVWESEKVNNVRAVIQAVNSRNIFHKKNLWREKRRKREREK